jgi:hypothetical protein
MRRITRTPAAAAAKSTMRWNGTIATYAGEGSKYEWSETPKPTLWRSAGSTGSLGVLKENITRWMMAPGRSRRHRRSR